MPQPILDRLVDGGDEPISVSDPEITSILRRLTRLLNSRKGTAPSCPEYGLPTLTSHIIDNLLVGDMVAAIQQCVERFEPRLCNVRVTWIRKAIGGNIKTQWPLNQEDCFWASFRISAQRVSDHSHLELCAEQHRDGDVLLRPFEG